MENRKTFAILTLGCKVNQYESEKLREELSALGLREVPPEEPADFYIVNTCTVTKEAARKSRQMIRRGMNKSPQAKIYAVGCGAEIAPEALGNISPQVILRKNEDKMDIPLEIAESLGTKAPFSPIPIKSGRIRANLKVQDGCDNFCSYCVIPYVRGRSRSREPEEILEELLQLENKGYKEVVLTGIHLGDYGKKIKNALTLPQLLEYLLKNSKIPRLRLSSLEPMDFSYELIDLFLKYPRLCPHMHLSLQHASDKILNLMRRNYTIAEYDKIICTAVENIDGMAITTDVIVGFPGETDEDFEFMYNYIKNAPLFMLHVFPFSSHPITRAAQMEGIVPKEIKIKRLKKLAQLGKEKIEYFLNKNIGKTVKVLVEQQNEDGKFSGHTENYVKVEFSAAGNLRGEIVEIKIIGKSGENLYGENP